MINRKVKFTDKKGHNREGIVLDKVRVGYHCSLTEGQTNVDAYVIESEKKIYVVEPSSVIEIIDAQ